MTVPSKHPATRLSVAPMMDWTDRHCRYFHRRLSGRARLYTEMVTAPALVRGEAVHLLAFDPAEQPLALQLGGSDPAELAAATRLAADRGYAEVNLNVGCPSDRVQSGCFGAVLMGWPQLVADCVAAMQDAADVHVSVKCRIGIDDQNPDVALPAFLEAVSKAGVGRFIIHARKAWLEGLSPKENRDIPPLDYDLVHRMKAAFPQLVIEINGGFTDLGAVGAQIAAGLDGVMVGRAAYHTPAEILLNADSRIFGDTDPLETPHAAARAMLPYIEHELSAGTRLHSITRHMLGLFAGRPGARGWRRTLSEKAHAPGAGPEVVEMALAVVPEVSAAAAHIA
ncbi:MAG: tRNA dihydrouridine(20/20a) synthase DusA [Pseudomonadota bacterium]